MASKTADAVKKATAPLQDKLTKANARSRELRKNQKVRKLMDAGEVAGGSVAAAVMHGAGLSIPIPGKAYRVPAGALIGLVGIGAGIAMDQEDIQSIGLGMASYGVARLIEQVVEGAVQGMKNGPQPA